MCGFRPPSEIAAHLASVPELRALVGEEASAAFVAAAAGPAEASGAVQAALRHVFSSLMHADAAQVAVQTAAVSTRLASEAPREAGGAPEPQHPDRVARALCAQYPGDVGIFAPYLLNTIQAGGGGGARVTVRHGRVSAPPAPRPLQLSPGEAVFLAANEPHAYLAGDCVEVMATSDNVGVLRGSGDSGDPRCSPSPSPAGGPCRPHPQVQGRRESRLGGAPEPSPPPTHTRTRARLCRTSLLRC